MSSSFPGALDGLPLPNFTLALGQASRPASAFLTDIVDSVKATQTAVGTTDGDAGVVRRGEMVMDLSRQAGVVGDGSTDDSAAITSAATSAASLGARLFARGAFRINSTVTMACALDMADATFTYHGAGTAVLLGGASVTFRRVMVLPRVAFGPKVIGSGWTSGTLGVEARNLNACLVTVPHIVGFETGLSVRGAAQGNSYNTYAIGHLDNNKRNLLLTADATGWSNQNTYLGGRYSHESSEGTDVAGARHILLENVANPVNNNLWLNASVEGSVAEQMIDVDGGSYNEWLNARLERSGGGKVRWGPNASQNVIKGGYNAHQVILTRVTGESQNLIQSPNLFELYGSSTIGVLRLQCRTGNASPAATIYGSASIADAEWAWRWSANQLEGKRPAESFARLILDALNGRVYVGTGSAAPTLNFRAVGTSGVQMEGGNLYFTDNTNDIGLITSLRPRYVRAATAVVTGNGATGSRPAAATAGIGAMFYDSTLGKPIWSTGSGWVDATGASV